MLQPAWGGQQPRLLPWLRQRALWQAYPGLLPRAARVDQGSGGRSDLDTPVSCIGGWRVV
jgi:hypothetical protein